MYYSKNNSNSISVPRNYSGNTFRVIDETERKYINEAPKKESETLNDLSTQCTEEELTKEAKKPVLPSIFNDISVEDVLLLGLMLVIHQENPNDTTLLLLLILLLAK